MSGNHFEQAHCQNKKQTTGDCSSQHFCLGKGVITHDDDENDISELFFFSKPEPDFYAADEIMVKLPLKGKKRNKTISWIP